MKSYESRKMSRDNDPGAFSQDRNRTVQSYDNFNPTEDVQGSK